MLGVVTVVVAVPTYLRFPAAQVVIEIVAATLAGLAAAFFLRRATPSLRWGVPLVIAAGVGTGSYLANSAVPPTSDQLEAATRLIHDSPLRSDRRVHADAFVNHGQFCIPSCEKRAMQSDFDGSVEEVLSDLARRLDGAGYRTTTQRDGASFLDFDADLARTMVIKADRGSLDLLISVAPADGGAVVASLAR